MINLAKRNVGFPYLPGAAVALFYSFIPPDHFYLEIKNQSRLAKVEADEAAFLFG